MNGCRYGAAFVGVAALLVPADVFAYCRTSACEEGQGTLCEPADPADCGVPLFWPTSCVGYVLQEDASDDFDLERTRALVREAFATWESADCEGGGVAIKTEDLGDVSCNQISYDPETKNANVIMFRDDDWPYAGGASALAITTVTYAVDSGEIRDVDMEINTEHVSFSTSDGDITVDLLSILTHEAGHFLGLGHSGVSSSTMVVEYPPESISLRSLDDDDVAGLCAIYPPTSNAPCESEPVNGLADECGEELGGCSCSSPRGAASSAAFALTLFGLAFARRKRSS